MIKFFSIFFFLFWGFSNAQEIERLHLKPYKVSVLSDTIRENSGLSFFGNQLFTINDGGNRSEVFEINPKDGKIRNTQIIPVRNVDWEALDFSDKALYIGDFGNNLGTRKDLKIFKIPYQNSKFQTDSIKTIPFYFEENKEINPKNLNTDFDMEAMVFIDGKIHVFTKEWVSKSTSHYIINPNESILQPAQFVEKIATGFVVTDASYFDKKLYLLGYTKKTEAYLMVFDETKPGIFFETKPRKFYLGSTLFLSQLEGIAVNKTGVFIAGEAFHSPLGIKKPTFYFIPSKDLP